MRYGTDVSNTPPAVDVALLECRVSDHKEGLCSLDLLGAEFFDDENMIILYTCQKDYGAPISYLQYIVLIGQSGQTFIGMFAYNDLGYQTLQFDGYVRGPSREDLVQRMLQLWNEGHVCIMHWHIAKDLMTHAVLP
jgi:anaphase-promoting complex subunit 4